MYGKKNRWILIIVCGFGLICFWMFVFNGIINFIVPERRALQRIGLNSNGLELTEVVYDYKEFENDGVALYSFVPNKKSIEYMTSWNKLPFNQETSNYLETRQIPEEFPDTKKGFWKIVYKGNVEDNYGFILCVYDIDNNTGHLLIYDL